MGLVSAFETEAIAAFTLDLSGSEVRVLYAVVAAWVRAPPH